MTKKELADLLSTQSSLTKSQAVEATDALVQILVSTLAAKEPIFLRGLGTFSIEQRAAKKVRNIKLRKEYVMPAYWAVKFRPARALKEAVK